MATTVKPADEPVDVAELLSKSETIFSAYLSLCDKRSISLLSDGDLRYLMQSTAAFSRYMGFREIVPVHSSDAYMLFISENANIAHARSKQILGASGGALLKLIAEIVNRTPGDEPAMIAGWSFSAIELASQCLVVMQAPAFGSTMGNRDESGPFGNGNVYLALVALQRALTLVERTMNNNNSASVFRMFIQLKQYLQAFSNALVQMIVYYLPQFVSLISQYYSRASVDRARPEDKLRYASVIALLNFVSMSLINQIAITPDSGLGFHTWSNLYEVLPKYEIISKNRAPVRESVIAALTEKYSNLTTIAVLEQLQAACRGLTTYDQGVIGKCDTDFLTMKSSVPCASRDELHDPSKSTSLHSHNKMIYLTNDTLPMPKATANYHTLRANEDSRKVRIGAMSLVSLMVKCAFATREDRRFMMTFVYMDSQEMHTFLEQSCSVSPSNMAMFMRCLNFELMDTKLYIYMMWCIQHTLNMPVPRYEVYKTYANDTTWRMGTNLFYHNYFSRSLEDDQVYYYDSEFFPTFGEWMQCRSYVESRIPYKIPAILLSATIVFSSTFLNSQMKSTHAAMTVVNADQRSLSEVFQLFIKELVADESEMSILTKGLLENVILPSFQGSFRGNHMVYTSFVSPTALRMFLARCRWSITDNIVMMAVEHTPFNLRLLSPPGDMQTPSEREAKRQRLAYTNRVINSVTSFADQPRSADIATMMGEGNSGAAAAAAAQGTGAALPFSMVSTNPVSYELTM